MSQSSGTVEEFLEQLRGTGQSSHGWFTMDRERSKELLARYRLQHPEAFGLNLVAAAVASEAEFIEIHASSKEFKISFDGRSFSAEELENCSSSLFLSERTTVVIRLQELAIGLQGALAIGCESLEVASHNEAGTMVYRYASGKQTLDRRPHVGGDKYRTEIRVLRKNPLGWLKNVLHPKRDVPEVQFIKSLCCWSPARISINGETLPHPPIPKNAIFATVLEYPESVETALQTLHAHDEDIRGVILFDPPPDVSHGLNIVVNGVCYNQPWDLSGWAVLHCGHMRKDLSQSALLKTDVEKLLEGLQERYAAHVSALCAAYPTLEGDRQATARLYLLDCRQGKAANFEALGRARREALLGEIERLPMLPLVAQEEQISIAKLREWGAPSHAVFYVLQKWSRPCLHLTPIVDATRPGVLDALRFEFKQNEGPSGVALKDGSNFLSEAQAADKRRQAWAEKPQTEPSIEGPMWVTEGVRWTNSWTGVAGLLKGAAERTSSVQFYLQGRPFKMQPLTLKEGWPNGLRIALEHPDSEADLHWTGLRPNGALEASAERLMREMVRKLIHEAAKLWHSGSVGHPEEMRRAFTVMLTLPDPPPLVRDLYLFQLAVPRVERKADLWEEQNATWLELHEQYQRIGCLPYANGSFPYAPRGGELVILANPWQESLWDAYFPQRQNYENQLRQADKREQNRVRWQNSRPVPVQLSLLPPLLGRTPLRNLTPEVVNIGGEMGARSGSPPFTTSRVEYYVDGRPLGARFVTCDNARTSPLPPGLAVALDCLELVPNESFTGVQDSPSLEMAYAAVRANLPELLDALAQDFPSEGAWRRQLQYHFFNGLASLDARIDDPRWAEVLCVDLVDGGWTPFCHLAELLVRQGTINVLVDESPPAPLEGLPPIFWFTRIVFEALLAWLGADRFTHCDELYLAGVYRKTKEARVVETATLPAAHFVEALTCDMGSGEIGLVTDPSIPPQTVRLRLLSGGKLVDQILLEEDGHLNQRAWVSSPLRVAAVLDCPDVGVQLSGPELIVMREFLLGAARRLGFSQASQLALMPPEERDALQDYLWGRLAWEATLGRGGSSHDPSGFTADEDAIRAELRHVAVFPGLDGVYYSLDDLLASLEGGQRVLYWFGQPPRSLPDEPILHARRDQVATLKSILGANHTQDATPLIQARQRRFDFESREPTAALVLPPKDYILRWEIEGQGFRGLIGLLARPGLNSTIHVHLQQRLLESVKISLDFGLEAVLDCPELKPDRDWNAVARDAAFDAMVHNIKVSAWEKLLSEAPIAYRIELAVRLRATRGKEVLALWQQPLLRDPWGQKLSLQELRKSYPDRRLLFWPAEMAAPDPQVVPAGKPLPQLEPAILDLLKPIYSVVQDYQQGAKAATELLQSLPLGEPKPDAQDGELLVELPHGWLVSRLDSKDRVCRLSWKERNLTPLTSQGWPGYRACIVADEWPLTASRELLRLDYHPELEEAEGKLQARWLEHLRRQPLSGDQLKKALETMPPQGALTEYLRSCAPPVEKSVLVEELQPLPLAQHDPWSDFQERIRPGLASLHGEERFELTMGRIDEIFKARRVDGKVVYLFHFLNPDQRERLLKMPLPWLMTRLWLLGIEGEERTPTIQRERHLKLVEWLLKSTH